MWLRYDSLLGLPNKYRLHLPAMFHASGVWSRHSPCHLHGCTQDVWPVPSQVVDSRAHASVRSRVFFKSVALLTSSMFLLIPDELSVFMASARFQPNVDDFRVPRICLHSKISQPVMVFRYRTNVTFISTENSTDLHDQCLVQFLRANHCRSLSSSNITKSPPRLKNLMSLPALLPKHGLNFPTSHFMLVSVSVTIAAKFATASRVPHMFVSNSPHQPGLCRSAQSSSSSSRVAQLQTVVSH